MPPFKALEARLAKAGRGAVVVEFAHHVNRAGLERQRTSTILARARTAEGKAHPEHLVGLLSKGSDQWEKIREEVSKAEWELQPVEHQSKKPEAKPAAEDDPLRMRYTPEERVAHHAGKIARYLMRERAVKPGGGVSGST